MSNKNRHFVKNVEHKKELPIDAGDKTLETVDNADIIIQETETETETEAEFYYAVVDGKAITTKTGIKSNGAVITNDDLDIDIIDDLIKKGFIEKVKK